MELYLFITVLAKVKLYNLQMGKLMYFTIQIANMTRLYLYWTVHNQMHSNRERLIANEMPCILHSKDLMFMVFYFLPTLFVDPPVPSTECQLFTDLTLTSSRKLAPAVLSCKITE